MIVALDFDGVIFDGTHECLLVAWNVFKKNTLSEFNIKKFDEIPELFIDLFKKSRSFVRHDGHFLVPFYIKENTIINSETFHKTYNSIPQEIIFEFRADFNKYRSKVRDIYSHYWLELHKKLLNLEEIIDLGIDVRIISGKDSDSIFFILQENGVKLIKEKIHGETSSKIPLLKLLKSEANDGNSKLLFIDDNIENIIESRKLGINSLWATWGFHTPEQINNAKHLLINEVKIDNIMSTIINLKMNK